MYRTLPDYPSEQKYNAKPVTPVSHSNSGGHTSTNSNAEKKVHIKKPLNAFMLYMKEMRAKVVAECTLKESAAINQILGRRVSVLLLATSNLPYTPSSFLTTITA